MRAPQHPKPAGRGDNYLPPPLSGGVMSEQCRCWRPWMPAVHTVGECRAERLRRAGVTQRDVHPVAGDG